MVNQNKTNMQFTGGDNLIGLSRCYHEVMMLNELRGGEGAYELSYAKGKSGFSFGGNQMDMSKRPKVIEIFIDILTHATDESGDMFFTEDDIGGIVGNDNCKLSEPSQSLEKVFGEFLPRINAALSSDYGRAKINAAYINEMNTKAEYIEKVIQLIHNPAAKKFYDSDLGRILLFDYHNQFRIKLNGVFMINYLDGAYHNKSKEIFSSKEKIVAPIDHYTLEDHKAYIRSTEQWYKYENDCKRRLENILNLYEDKKPQKDPSYLKSFGLHWDEIKGEWVEVEPIPFTGKWFFEYDPSKHIYSMIIVFLRELLY